jgi:hypothetical protein
MFKVIYPVSLVAKTFKNSFWGETLQLLTVRIRLAILMPIQLRVWIRDWHQNNAIQM